MHNEPNCFHQISTTTSSNYYESNAVKFLFHKKLVYKKLKADRWLKKLRASRAALTFLRKFLVRKQNAS